MKIEPLPQPSPISDPNVLECCLYLREQIEKAFAIPHLEHMHRHDRARLLAEAHRRTEAMQQQLHHLMMTHWWPGVSYMPPTVLKR